MGSAKCQCLKVFTYSASEAYLESSGTSSFQMPLLVHEPSFQASVTITDCHFPPFVHERHFMLDIIIIMVYCI